LPSAVHYFSVTIVGTKRRTVVNAEPNQIERAMALVRQGRYRNLSDFVREAIDEKLRRVEDALLEDEVARYCAAGHADEDTELIAMQHLAVPKERSRPVKKASRAKR
jgi:Arc/MetJ-type ribon-helix-helix transcriptional regulator